MRTITESQAKFVATLAAERNAAIGADATIYAALTEALDGTLSIGGASALIDALKRLPRDAAPAAAKAAPGYYVADDGTVIVVVKTKDGERTYAKRLEFSVGEAGRKTAAWVYAPGVGKTLAGIAPLTVAEAARLGHKHGFCVICAKALTDPVSVDRGIGPVCVKKLGGGVALAA